MVIQQAELDPTQRFSTRVSDYIKYRPNYPQALFDFIKTQLSPGDKVADVGSGTGISTRHLLDHGYTVFAVEPNDDMRAAAEQQLATNDRFHSINGTGEKTTLPDGSTNWVFCAQAFHWLNPKSAAIEFRRISAPGALVALVWNERKLSGTKFLDRYERLLHAFGTDYAKVSHQGKKTQTGTLDVFGSEMKIAEFPNAQYLDLEGLLGRAFSCSYTPLPGTEGHARLTEELTRLFEECQAGGFVEMPYDTRIYYTSL